jgi:hypothetical protein
MRNGELTGTSIKPSGPMPGDGAPAQASQNSRALVALAPAAGARETLGGKAPAVFLAHLIAMKRELPQTRARRRAEPNEALAAYRASAALKR